jgi:hypothetical protein
MGCAGVRLTDEGKRVAVIRGGHATCDYREPVRGRC